MIAKLLSVERGDRERIQSAPRSPSCWTDGAAKHALVGQTKDVEAILSMLYPIELAIMQTPAQTIAGLGVKARHAAYLMSPYWEAPIEQIDWDARAVRLLIEAVCERAGLSLPFEGVAGSREDEKR